MQLGFPRIYQSSQEVFRQVVRVGCSGTACFELVFRLGMEALHTETLDVETRTEG